MLWLTLTFAHAFCGNYVGPVDSTPENGASRIVMAHQGDRTIVTMTSNALDAPIAFGMLMPVPADLTVDAIEARDDLDAAWVLLDEYTAPRIVSYTCDSLRASNDFIGGGSSSGCNGGCVYQETALSAGQSYGEALLEAQVEVLGVSTSGVYELTLLDAVEASGLQAWLGANGFGTVPGADALLQQYIDEGVNFLAARVVLPGSTDEAWLQPLRITYPSRTESLPLRLGALNATGDQELTVWVIDDADAGEAQVLSFSEIEVEAECMPAAGEEVPDTLDEAIEDARGGDDGVALVEYSWPTLQKCDPCPIGPASDPATFLGDFGRTDDDAHITRLRVRYDALSLTEDLHLASTGVRTQRQIRYIEHLDELEETFPICGEGYASDPAGTCADDGDDKASLPWGALLLLPLLGWRLRR